MLYLPTVMRKLLVKKLLVRKLLVVLSAAGALLSSTTLFGAGFSGSALSGVNVAAEPAPSVLVDSNAESGTDAESGANVPESDAPVSDVPVSDVPVSDVPVSDVPKAIQCYEEATNSEDIENYMSCFIADPMIIDVGRTIEGYTEVKKWALREVISYGKSFEHRKVLEEKKGYAKTEVKWRSWVVHYYYWWNKSDKIVKMDLQYAD